MTYKPIPTQADGTKTEALTADDDVRDLLSDIRGELRAIRLHLESMTEIEIDPHDTEEE